MTRIDAAFRGRLGDFHLDVAFSLPASGATVLFGPSGCGKTTVLRCIAGLERIPGRLNLGGEVWQDERTFVAPHRRAVGYVFQEPSLLPHLSVRRNLVFGYRRAGAARLGGLDQIVALLGLESLLERGVARLSGGERQRVAIGRALLSQPRLLLMDEPLASLDAGRKDELMPYLERMRGELKVPMLYVTHDLSEAARLSDQMIVMKHGQSRPPSGLRVVEPDDAELRRRLKEVGPEVFAAELIRRGVSAPVARLAASAIQTSPEEVGCQLPASDGPQDLTATIVGDGKMSDPA